MITIIFFSAFSFGLFLSSFLILLALPRNDTAFHKSVLCRRMYPWNSDDELNFSPQTRSINRTMYSEEVLAL